MEADKLKELDSFKSRLYTNLTHEFRTPLTVILGMAEQIKRAPEKYLDNGVELIRNNGKNLLQLINQLLDLSKLESGAFQLKLQQGMLCPISAIWRSPFKPMRTAETCPSASTHRWSRW
ncbi:MAG: HAMP domain-containing histidine kinase [Lewinellaceae bacterium]|nr:HAMP domain-containing histidine kinase [Lewinellaceae bacterium]